MNLLDFKPPPLSLRGKLKSSVTTFNTPCMVTQNMLRMYKGNKIFSEIYFRLVTALKNVLNRSNNQFQSKRAHLFLSYHLIYVPCPDVY